MSSLLALLSDEDQHDKDLGEALREVRRSHAEMAAVTVRLTQYHDQFRDERDVWIVKAILTARSPGEKNAIKRDVCIILGVTPQWLNRMLKGDAYRRRTD